MPIRISDPDRGQSLAVEYPRLYTAAFCAAGLPPVTSVTLENASRSSVSVTLHIPAIHYGAQASGLRPGVCWRPCAAMRETILALEQITHRTPTDIAVLADGREIARLPIVLMDVWSWPHDATSRIVAATYVLPGDRAVARVVTEVFGDDPTLGAGEASGRWGATGIVAAFYRHMGRSWSMRYSPPRVVVDDQMNGASYQMITSPQDVLAHFSERQGTGNCLDLTLLFAGCFESLGLQPLVFFVGEPGEAPRHSFPGIWSTRARRFQPLLTDRADLERRVRAGEIVAFEATGVCGGQAALSVEDAMAAARARFEGNEPIHAIDVAASRPPAGQVQPLELPNAPVVQKIVWKGQQLALASGARRLETLHVLYGLCTAGGETTRVVLARAGLDPKHLIEAIEKIHGGPVSANLPPPTHNYESCWRAARANAHAGGHSRLEEIDLWWALVENPGRNVPRVLAAAGGDLVRVAQEVTRCGGRSGLHSISLDFPPRVE